MNESITDSALTSGRVLAIIERLHRWRIKHNGAEIGFGHDQYKPDYKFHYAEAYALWGNGYVKFYQITKKKEYLVLAENAAEWLIKNRNIKYKEFSWGLPWEWQGCLSNFSYLITSVFGGNFFLNLYKITKENRYLEVAQSVGNWILNECGFDKENEEVWFYYSDHEAFRYPVFNVISKASGFLAKLYAYTKEPCYLTMAKLAANYVINRQNQNGSWYYSIKRKYIDNVHTGFTIEGLIDVFLSIPEMRNILQPVLLKAYNFYSNNLYDKNGYGMERVENSYIRRLIKLVRRQTLETRLHGYASGIRCFIMLYHIFRLKGMKDKALSMIKYVMDNLLSENNAFRFKSKCDRYYIRQEAHIFDALLTAMLKSPYI